MALHDQILRDIIAGRVPWRFRTSDLKTIPATKSGRYRVGNGEYSGNTIKTVPRNHSVRPDRTESWGLQRRVTTRQVLEIASVHIGVFSTSPICRRMCSYDGLFGFRFGRVWKRMLR